MEFFLKEKNSLQFSKWIFLTIIYNIKGGKLKCLKIGKIFENLRVNCKIGR